MEVFSLRGNAVLFVLSIQDQMDRCKIRCAVKTHVEPRVLEIYWCLGLGDYFGPLFERMDVGRLEKEFY